MRLLVVGMLISLAAPTTAHALAGAKPVRCATPTAAIVERSQQALDAEIARMAGSAREYRQARETCYIRHPQYGWYALSTFSIEGWHGGNNHSWHFAMGRLGRDGGYRTLGTGVIGGNATLPSEVVDGSVSGIRWHNAECMDIVFPARKVPEGANPSFPDKKWRRTEMAFLCKHAKQSREKAAR